MQPQIKYALKFLFSMNIKVNGTSEFKFLGVSKAIPKKLYILAPSTVSPEDSALETTLDTIIKLSKNIYIHIYIHTYIPSR